MIVQRVERHLIKKTSPNWKQIDNLCFKSKNLYNFANYIIRQDFINKRLWIRYNELDKLIKSFHMTSDNPYHKLYAQMSQQILILLDKNWKSFFKSIKDWKNNPSKYKGMPKLPKYKHRIKGRNLVIIPKQHLELSEEGILDFSTRLNLTPIKTRILINKIQQIRIIPESNHYWLEIVYRKEIQNERTLNPNNVLSIDLGVNNFATCVNNLGRQPFIINGRPIKSMNQFYNKKLSEFKKHIEGKHIKKLYKKKSSNRINKLTLKRNNKINDYMHKSSRYIIDYCLKNKIDTIIIGYNPEWKQEINHGRVNNQNFVSIPFLRFIGQLQYKAEEYGIQVILINEAYTSKCSFLDNESLEHHNRYLGRRIKRGMFRSANDILINADVNAGYNIMKKAISKPFEVDGIEGVGLHPIRINVDSNKDFLIKIIT